MFDKRCERCIILCMTFFEQINWQEHKQQLWKRAYEEYTNQLIDNGMDPISASAEADIEMIRRMLIEDSDSSNCSLS